MDSPILGVNGFQMKNISQMSVKMADHAVTPGKVSVLCTVYDLILSIKEHDICCNVRETSTYGKAPQIIMT